MRLLALLVAALLVAACEPEMPQTASTTPRLDAELLDEQGADLAVRATGGADNARFGAAMINLESGELWAFNGSDRFPMMSVFKAPLGAAVLAEVDAGRLDLDETITLTDEDLSPPFSPIADAYPGRRTYTVGQLLELAVGQSDNTAADVLMRRIGGPGVVTAWLRAHRIDDMRVDRYERQMQPELAGLDSFRPEWKGESAYGPVHRGVPDDRRFAATLAFMRDPRDTTTPRAALLFLSKLSAGELLSEASTERLLTIMSETTTGADRLKAGLPEGARLAHKTGTARTDFGMNPATNDMGIITLPDGRRYAVAVFLSGSPLDGDSREAVIADFARLAVRAAG